MMPHIECNRCGDAFEPTEDTPSLAINNPLHITPFRGTYHLNVCADCYRSFEEWWHDTEDPA